MESVIERSNDLLQEKVKNPAEALLDFRLINVAAELGAEKLAKLPIGVHDLNVGTFMERFVSFFRGRTNDLDDNEDNNTNNDNDANNNNNDNDNDSEDEAAPRDGFIKVKRPPEIDWTAFGIELYGQVCQSAPAMGFL